MVSAVLWSEEGDVAVEQLDAGGPLGLAFGRDQHPAGVEALAGHRGDRHGGPLPLVLVIDLGHRAVELAQVGRERAQHRPLVLQRGRVGQAQLEPEHGDEHGAPHGIGGGHAARMRYRGISTISYAVFCLKKKKNRSYSLTLVITARYVTLITT